MFTILESVWEYTMSELGLAGKDEPAPQPAPQVVVSSERGGSLTMERAGRDDGKLLDDYRHVVFERDMVVISYTEITVKPLAA